MTDLQKYLSLKRCDIISFLCVPELSKKHIGKQKLESKTDYTDIKTALFWIKSIKYFNSGDDIYLFEYIPRVYIIEIW